MKFDEIEYKKLSEIKKELLHDFYFKAFPLRSELLFNNWRWLCRNSLNNLEPIVALHNKKVIAHAGLISTQIKFNKNVYNAIWFIDFFILPQYRNLGLGSAITEKWMSLEKNHLTFCNEKSLKIFKKLDWMPGKNFYKSCKILNPFKWIPLLRSFDQKKLNKVNFFNIFEKSIYSENVKLIKLSENQKIFFDLIKLTNSGSLEDSKPKIIKDQKWMEWRIFESPFINNYFLFLVKESFVIVSISSNHKKKLNIIFSKFENENYKLILINSIIKWSIENNIDVVWLSLDHISQSKKIKDIFKLKFELIFACNSFEQSLKKDDLNMITNLEGVDSDLEVLNYSNKNYFSSE